MSVVRLSPLLLIVLGACAQAPVIPAAPPAPALQGPLWSLVELRGQPVDGVALPQLPRVQLRDGRVTGSGGCNRLSGAYQADASALRFGPTASTRRACLEGGDLENRFLSAMGEVAGWSSSPGWLLWLAADGRVLARFNDNLRAYQCSEGGEALARSERGGEGLTLFHAGRSYAMHRAPSGSGVRYVVEQGRRPDFSMEWFEKDGEALISEAPLDHSRKPEDLRLLIRCTLSAG